MTQMTQMGTVVSAAVGSRRRPKGAGRGERAAARMRALPRAGRPIGAHRSFLQPPSLHAGPACGRPPRLWLRNLRHLRIPPRNSAARRRMMGRALDGGNHTTAPWDGSTKVDVLRGLLMVLMALDHVGYIVGRFHSQEMWAGAWTRDDGAVPFLTRFVTHFCAPGFFLLMGAGMALAAGARARQGWPTGRIALDTRSREAPSRPAPQAGSERRARSLMPGRNFPRGTSNPHRAGPSTARR
jgi:hypothetical protein